MNIIIKSTVVKSIVIIFVAMIFVFSMITLLPIYGQETTTTNSITDLVKTNAE